MAAKFFDGGVLEISSPNINGGAFTDVTDPAVGGSFVTGGYNGKISSDVRESRLAGRMAWTGNSGGYITSRIEPRTEPKRTNHPAEIPHGVRH